MMPALLENKPAVFDSFAGLIKCRVLKVHGKAHAPTTAVKVDFEITETRGAYLKGEKLTRSSLHVVPLAAIIRKPYSTKIGHYTVGK